MISPLGGYASLAYRNNNLNLFMTYAPRSFVNIYVIYCRTLNKYFTKRIFLLLIYTLCANAIMSYGLCVFMFRFFVNTVPLT